MAAELLQGRFGKVLAGVARMVALSPAFQVWTQTQDLGQAAARVHLLRKEAAGWVRPCCLVAPMSDFRIETDGVGGGFEFPPSASGGIRLHFEQVAPADWETDPERADVLFMDRVDRVVEDLIQMSARPGMVAIRAFAPAADPTGVAYEGEAPQFWWTWRLEV